MAGRFYIFNFETVVPHEVDTNHVRDTLCVELVKKGCIPSPVRGSKRDFNRSCKSVGRQFRHAFLRHYDVGICREDSYRRALRQTAALYLPPERDFAYESDLDAGVQALLRYTAVRLEEAGIPYDSEDLSVWLTQEVRENSGLFMHDRESMLSDAYMRVMEEICPPLARTPDLHLRRSLLQEAARKERTVPGKAADIADAVLERVYRKHDDRMSSLEKEWMQQGLSSGCEEALRALYMNEDQVAILARSSVADPARHLRVAADSTGVDLELRLFNHDQENSNTLCRKRAKDQLVAITAILRIPPPECGVADVTYVTNTPYDADAQLLAGCGMQVVVVDALKHRAKKATRLDNGIWHVPDLGHLNEVENPFASFFGNSVGEQLREVRARAASRMRRLRARRPSVHLRARECAAR
ncbi:MAG: hypothetical protein ACOCWQ_00140 [Nanoarchaeota archaeon]